MYGKDADLKHPLFDGLMTKKQLAALLDCTERAVEDYIKRERLPLHHVGPLRLIDIAQAMEAIRNPKAAKPETGVRRGRPRKIAP